ncbi:MAG: primosomal protein N', partial [Bilifractor sp.]
MSLEKERYADVIVDVTQASMDRSYQYRIPPELENKVRVGCVVRIPFGNGKRSAEGYVLNIGTEPRIAKDRIKPIIEVPDNRVTIESKLIELALWMKTTYGSSLNNALKTVLPVREKEKHAVREEVSLVWPEKKTRLLLEQYTRRHYAAKVRLLTALLKTNELEKSYVTGTLKITPESLRSLEREGVISVRSADLTRTPDDLQEPEEKEEPCILTAEQSRVCSGILREWEGANRPCLIRGVTGSGKTLVYMDLMEKVLKEGRQVILLIPEIALSWQNVKRFRSRFGNAVTILNSKMSKGERYDQFERLKKGEAQIVIGPRSALFTPFPELGLIIIDEEQESSYRSENAPRYDARETALERARIENAHVVFGSATPSVDSVFRCREGRYAGFLLESRYGNADLPAVHVEDMREELRHGNRSILSEALRKAISERLARKEQTILFLNRRGYSGFISCRSCGEVIK